MKYKVSTDFYPLDQIIVNPSKNPEQRTNDTLNLNTEDIFAAE